MLRKAEEIAKDVCFVNGHLEVYQVPKDVCFVNVPKDVCFVNGHWEVYQVYLKTKKMAKNCWWNCNLFRGERKKKDY